MIIKTVHKSLRLVDKIILGLKYTVCVKVLEKCMTQIEFSINLINFFMIIINYNYYKLLTNIVVSYLKAFLE